jgi:hypothetical protein
MQPFPHAVRPVPLCTLAVMLLVIVAAADAADAPPPAAIPRASGAITVDGVMDEPAWRDALFVELPYEFSPGKNIPAPVRTECRLAYDDRRLYVGCHAFDPEPRAIRAHLSDRDTAFNDDSIALVLDTFHDQRRGYELHVNPFGVQGDLSFNELAAGGDKEDSTWDAIWDSAGRLTPDGFTVEMAIPFTSLRVQRRAGAQTWGIWIVRNYPRSVRHQMANARLDLDQDCLLCQAPAYAGFVDIEPGLDLEVDPTVTVSRTDMRTDFPAGRLAAGNIDTEPGITALWGATPNVRLAGALNPDFSQVEADVAELEVNTRFALFYPEKRPFFMEGADFFATPFNAVHTRTVADPSWGLRGIGKGIGGAFGAFVARDGATTLLLPGSQRSSFAFLDEASTDAVLRYRRDVGEASAVGVLLTSRQADGYHNRVGGLDANLRLGQSDTLNAQLLASTTRYPDALAAAEDQPVGELRDTAAHLDYRHDSREWFWAATLENVGREFRADLGYMPQVDLRHARVVAQRTWWGDHGEWYTRIFAGGMLFDSRDQHGDLLERILNPWIAVEGPGQTLVEWDYYASDVGFAGRGFTQDYHTLYVRSRPSATVSGELQVRFGDDLDVDNARAARGLRVAPDLQLDVGRHTRLELRHTYERLDVGGRRLFTARLSELRGVYQLDVRTFVRVILQYLDLHRDPRQYTATVEAEERNLFTQFLFSYKLNPQTVVFVGYSGTRLGDAGIDLTERERTAFLKVGYAWRP